jgi:hypothetical protein
MVFSSFDSPVECFGAKQRPTTGSPHIHTITFTVSYAAFRSSYERLWLAPTTPPPGRIGVEATGSTAKNLLGEACTSFCRQVWCSLASWPA